MKRSNGGQAGSGVAAVQQRTRQVLGRAQQEAESAPGLSRLNWVFIIHYIIVRSPYPPKIVLLIRWDEYSCSVCPVMFT